MPQVSLVGDGHGGSEDYSTLDSWWATESAIDYGGTIEAQCLGDCGRFTPTAASVGGAEIYTLSVTYDGTNDSSLSVGDRFILGASAASVTAPIDFHDLKVTSTNAFTDSYVLNSDYTTHTRFRIDNPNTNNDALTIDANIQNSSFDQLIASGGLNVGESRFGDGCPINNALFFGGAGKGWEGSTSTSIMVITDAFAFNNTGDDYDSTQITINTCASEDTTGTSGITNYTSSELVDFAGGDYRTKSSSALATAGSGGSYIGAFLQPSAGSIIPVFVNSYRQRRCF